MKKALLFIFCIVFFFFIIKFILLKILFSSPAPYYAVFLTNGQVYFGHLNKLDGTTIELANVYYLRTNTNLSDQALQQKNNTANLHLTLIKLGQEIHGPTNYLFINRQQVLFWEKLRENGQVAQAIKNHE